MIQALARRFRQWIRRPELPPGDVAGDSWVDVGRLPPASLMPVEEPGLIPLDLPAPPPLPLDARPPKTRDELEWEALLARMLARPAAAPIAASDPTAVDPDPTPTAPVVTQAPPAIAPQAIAVQPVAPQPMVSSSDPTLELAQKDENDENDDWDAVIARARARVADTTPIEDETNWEALIAATKARLAETPARPASTLVRTPPPVRLTSVVRDPGNEERAWEELIARAKRQASSIPARPAASPRRRPKQETGETGEWSALIAAAKLRHQLHDRA